MNLKEDDLGFTTGIYRLRRRWIHECTVYERMLLQMPQRGIADFADVPKGGGFEYSRPITIIEHFPQYAAESSSWRKDMISSLCRGSR